MIDPDKVRRTLDAANALQLAREPVSEGEQVQRKQEAVIGARQYVAAWMVRGAELVRVYLDEATARAVATPFKGAVIPLYAALHPASSAVDQMVATAVKLADGPAASLLPLRSKDEATSLHTEQGKGRTTFFDGKSMNAPRSTQPSPEPAPAPVGETDVDRFVSAAVKLANAPASEPILRPPADAGSPEGIYIASKTVHANRWRFLRDKVGEPIISSWIDEADDGDTADWDDLWRRCLGEAARAAVTIIYHEPGEILKGALVEVGAALSHGRTVIVVGDPPGSWVRTKAAIRVSTMKEAIAKARELLAAVRPKAGGKA